MRPLPKYSFHGGTPIDHAVMTFRRPARIEPDLSYLRVHGANGKILNQFHRMKTRFTHTRVLDSTSRHTVQMLVQQQVEGVRCLFHSRGVSPHVIPANEMWRENRTAAKQSHHKCARGRGGCSCWVCIRAGTKSALHAF